jgi:hypothetical protein
VQADGSGCESAVNLAGAVRPVRIRADGPRRRSRRAHAPRRARLIRRALS